VGDTLLIERDGPLAWLTLNRPERLNALNGALLGEITAALAELKDDASARVLAIRGAGRAFSAGYDMRAREDAPAGAGSDDDDEDIVDDFEHLCHNLKIFESIWDYPKPVIAAVHGYCLAGATQLCVECDMTVVARDAQIGFPAIPAGGGYISPMWMLHVGPKRAKQMSFQASSRISGQTAVEWGWANYAVDQDALFDDVAAMARRIAKIPAPIIRMKKYSINRAAEIQGHRLIPTLGAETDAVLHYSKAVKELQAMTRELGMKAAIQHFQES
jgi:enoyl-CoA hydratase/carnithine racemase